MHVFLLYYVSFHARLCHIIKIHYTPPPPLHAPTLMLLTNFNAIIIIQPTHSIILSYVLNLSIKAYNSFLLTTHMYSGNCRLSLMKSIVVLTAFGVDMYTRYKQVPIVALDLYSCTLFQWQCIACNIQARDLHRHLKSMLNKRSDHALRPSATHLRSPITSTSNSALLELAHIYSPFYLVQISDL